MCLGKIPNEKKIIFLLCLQNQNNFKAVVGNHYHRGPKKSCDFGRGLHNSNLGYTHNIYPYHFLFPGGGHSNESGWYVPTGTGEQKQGAFGVEFRRKKGIIGCGISKNRAFFGVNFRK